MTNRNKSNMPSMKLKTIFCSLLLSSLTSICFSQKCEVKEDPITGEKTLQFKNVYQTLRFENKGGDSTAFFTTFSYGGEQNVVLPAESEVIFKLKNDEILKLKSIKEAAPKTIVTSSSVITHYTFAFVLTKDDLKKLASDKIIFIRYPSTDGGTVDFDVKGLGKVFVNKITTGANCIYENLK